MKIYCAIENGVQEALRNSNYICNKQPTNFLGMRANTSERKI